MLGCEKLVCSDSVYENLVIVEESSDGIYFPFVDVCCEVLDLDFIYLCIGRSCLFKLLLLRII